MIWQKHVDIIISVNLFGLGKSRTERISRLAPMWHLWWDPLSPFSRCEGVTGSLGVICVPGQWVRIIISIIISINIIKTLCSLRATEAEQVVTFPQISNANIDRFRCKGFLICVIVHFMLIFSIPAFSGTASLAWLTVWVLVCLQRTVSSSIQLALARFFKTFRLPSWPC